MAAQNNNIKAQSANSLVIFFPILDWLFFSRKQRQLLRKLKANGDLRVDGVLYRILLLALILLFGGGLTLFFILLPGKNQLVENVFAGIFGIFTVGFFLAARTGGGLLHVTGVLAQGEILSVSIHKFSLTPGCIIRFRYKTKAGVEVIKKDRIQEHEFGETLPKEGEVILLYYDEKHPDRYQIAIPQSLKKFCVQESLYQRICRANTVSDLINVLQVESK